MKYFGLIVLFAMVAGVFALQETGAEEPLQELARFMDMGEVNSEAGNVRSPRLICDTLQIRYHGVSLENLLCAAKCHRLRRRIGHCQGGVCVCH